MSPPSVVKARIDLEEGRLWRARDRLESFVAHHPSHAEALDLLGDVLERMGDLPHAGRYWMLTSRVDERALRTFDALRELYRRPDRVLSSLPIRDPIGAYPPEALQRIEALRQEADAAGHAWSPRSNRPPGTWAAAAPPAEHWWPRIVAYAAVILVLVILVLGAVRFGEVVVSLLDWLIGR